jgi:hypothetical protein
MVTTPIHGTCNTSLHVIVARRQFARRRIFRQGVDGGRRVRQLARRCAQAESCAHDSLGNCARSLLPVLNPGIQFGSRGELVLVFVGALSPITFIIILHQQD